MKKQLQIISLFTISLFLLSSEVSYAQLIEGLQGNGTKNDPVLIQSVNDLKSVSNYVNSGGNSANKYFKVTKSIDFTNEVLDYDLDEDGDKESNFRPIGESLAIPFSGFFDGSNCVISGLKIKSKGEFIGLIGVAVGPSSNGKTEIKNISIIQSHFESLSGEAYLGGITGYTQWCDLKNCNTSIEMISRGNYSIVGGINAYNFQNAIEDCFSISTITSTGEGSTLGGVISAGGQLGNIDRCYASINIESTGDSCYIGGFAGSTHTPINNCYSKGILSVSGKGCVIGGFIGGITTGGNITNAYSTCTVTSNNDNKNGGFVGELLAQAKISNSYYIDLWSNQIYEDNTLGVAKSESDMKNGTFVSTLNNNQSPLVWSGDVDNKNDGFPILEPQNVSIQDISSKNKIAVSYENAIIKINGDQLKFIQITDVQGRIVERKNVSGNYSQVEFNQPKGIYIITVGTAEGIQSFKQLVVG